MTERTRLNKKTYIYYYSLENGKLAYWTMHHKFAENKNVASCSCALVASNDREHAYELMVTYK